MPSMISLVLVFSFIFTSSLKIIHDLLVMIAFCFFVQVLRNPMLLLYSETRRFEDDKCHLLRDLCNFIYDICNPEHVKWSGNLIQGSAHKNNRRQVPPAFMLQS